MQITLKLKRPSKELLKLLSKGFHLHLVVSIIQPSLPSYLSRKGHLAVVPNCDIHKQQTCFMVQHLALIRPQKSLNARGPEKVRRLSLASLISGFVCRSTYDLTVKL